MKFSRLMFVFSGVHLRTRRESFFFSISLSGDQPQEEGVPSTEESHFVITHI